MLLAGGQGTRHKNLEGTPGQRPEPAWAGSSLAAMEGPGAIVVGSGGAQRSMVRFPEMIP